VPPGFWIVACFFFIGVPWGLSVAGIRPTIRVLVFTSGIEIVFLVMTSLFIIAHAHPVAPLQPFSLAAVGLKGVAMGMIFAITSFIGVGSHAPLGEETRGPRTQRGRMIGKAAIVSLTLVGAALTLAAYALTVGWGEANMAAFATAPAPGVLVYLHYLGWVGAVALVVLAINSALMDSLALLTASARVLYAVGRDKLLQTHFAAVNGRRAPARSVSVLAALAVALAVGTGLWLGPAAAFDMLTTAVLFGLVSAHTLMNAALMRLAHREADTRPPAAGWARVGQILVQGVLPVVAVALFWGVLYESLVPFVFPLTWAALLWGVVIGPSAVWAYRAALTVPRHRQFQLGVALEEVEAVRR